MRKAHALAIAVLLVTVSACGQGSEGASDTADNRVIVVDHSYDDLVSYHWRFFPRSMKARAGDTLLFRREFTGEPHTVVLGTIGADAMDAVEKVDFKYANVGDDSSAEEIAEVERLAQEASKSMPPFAEYPNVAQNAAQPCYLDTGSPPRDLETPCSREQQEQPEFTGKQTYYSSGLIPTSGPDANEYRVPLADDIEPGEYRYYCAIHFPFMQGKIEVVGEQEEVPPASQVERTWKGSLSALENPLRQALAAARKDQATLHDVKLQLPLAGLYSHPEFSVAMAEFLPETIKTRVGEPVTWTFLWGHTISFNAPRDLPAFLTDEDGTVRRNPMVDQSAGGSPPVEPLDFDLPRLVAQSRFTNIRRVDGGTWDGEGFFSSGLIGSEPYATYTVRVSKAGRYRYSCLLHPRMVGTLDVGE